MRNWVPVLIWGHNVMIWWCYWNVWILQKKKKNVQYVHLTGFQIGTCNLGA